MRRCCPSATCLARQTSITISGIRYVVDTGHVKVRAHDARSKIEALMVVPVSKAQARQRSGRAGREAPGLCCLRAC